MKKNLKVIISAFYLLVIIASNTYPDVLRSVLLENFTSTTCGPCASNNPGLKAWMESHWVNLVAVSYHVWYPAPGDPMYNYNPSPCQTRNSYYAVPGIPYGKMMGAQTYLGSPFPWSNLDFYYTYWSGQTTPAGMTLTDTRIPGDSIRCDIVVTNYSNLPSGNYALRVFVVERRILYASPPGSNGETDFRNVFRACLPNIQGTQVPLAAGTYNFQFKYKLDMVVWRDTSIYTIAFIQNDNDKSVLNSTRQGVLLGIDPYINTVPSGYSLKQNYPNPFNPTTTISFDLPKDQTVTLKVYDMLGNEVKTMVEGYHRAGTYNMSFDASGFASGIYFYTLKTDSFTETKKMILVK